MADWHIWQRLLEVEWQLNCRVFLVVQKFRLSVVDLFTTRESAQGPRFFAQTSQPGAEAVDALQCPWPEELLYAFPQVALMQRVI